MNTTMAFIAGFALCGLLALIVCVLGRRATAQDDAARLDFMDSREIELVHNTEHGGWAALHDRKMVTRGENLREVLDRTRGIVK